MEHRFMRKISGHCLCGSLNYISDAEPILIGLCHCLTCQRQSGSAYSVNVAVPKDSLKIEGQALKIFNTIGGSGQPVQLFFCGHCGSAIATSAEAIPGLAFIKAGTLDETSWINPTLEIWCESAQSWIEHDPSRQLVDRNPLIAS
jgi:hypothetical protein